ncbi:MAG: hypothetical protein ACRCX2_38960 [Paraclostridium sp.]
MSKSEIKTFFDKHKTKDRDIQIMNRMSSVLQEQQNSLIDGLVKDIPTIGDSLNSFLLEPYDIMDYIEAIKNVPVLKKSSEVNKPLRLALITSAADTKDINFVIFLFIQLYSGLYRKYWKYGSNADRMKFLIENRMTLKDDYKSEGTLIRMLKKKAETYVKNYSKELNRMNDQDYLTLIQGAYARINSTLKGISKMYYDKSIEHTATANKIVGSDEEGLSKISSSEDVYSKILEVATGTVSFNISNVHSIGILRGDKEFDMFCVFIKFAISHERGRMINIMTNLINEWLKRNPKRSKNEFRKTFTSISSARNMDVVHKDIEDIMIQFRKTNPTSFDTYRFKKHLLNYCILHIYVIALKEMS